MVDLPDFVKKVGNEKLDGGVAACGELVGERGGDTGVGGDIATEHGDGPLALGGGLGGVENSGRHIDRAGVEHAGVEDGNVEHSGVVVRRLV